MDEAERVAAARAQKRARNRRDHQRSKASAEHVLLRLDPGGSAALDAGARAAGLSRAAFARMFPPALAAALGGRYADIERARAGGSRSLGQFLAQAIDRAIASPKEGAGEPPPEAGSEFDRLFGGA